MNEEFVPQTQARVPRHTDEEVNECIRRELEARIYYYAKRLDEIERRLDELDWEWDIERLLEANAAFFATLGVILGHRHPKWRLLSVVVGGFLFQHAIQGWCPPVAIFRRLGVRTMGEINHERYALKALRGDFDEINSKSGEESDAQAEKVLRAADANL